MVGKALPVDWSVQHRTLGVTLLFFPCFPLFSQGCSHPAHAGKGFTKRKNNCRNQGYMGCIPCALIPIMSQGPAPPVMSYCRCWWDPSPPWGQADAGWEVKSGILTMAECVPSFSGRALHQEARSAAGQHVHRATKKTPSAAECTRAFVYSL